jgi:hypothetical protein
MSASDVSLTQQHERFFLSKIAASSRRKRKKEQDALQPPVKLGGQ